MRDVDAFWGRRSRPPVRRRGAARALRVGLALASIMGLSLGTGGVAGSAQSAIPPGMLALYRDAARSCPGLPWEVLAAIGRIESDHGRNTRTSRAGAEGPMQFMPGTWSMYGLDANGDGLADPWNPTDAVHGTAAMLCAMDGGDPNLLRTAVARYNPRAPSYSGAVMAEAVRYGLGGTPIELTLLQGEGAHGGHVRLSGIAARDVDAGTVDPGLLAVLRAIGQRHDLEVSVFRTGHSRYVEGTTRISLHTHGMAADISRVDGRAVNAANDGARNVVEWLARLPAPLRPVEVGSPFGDMKGDGLFSDRAHRDHIHIGMAAVSGPVKATDTVAANSATTAVSTDPPCAGAACSPAAQDSVAAIACLDSGCSGAFGSHAVQWSCRGSACSGTFAGRTSSWSCGPGSCTGTLGGQPAWWYCDADGCSGSFGQTSRSWTCSPSGCSGWMPLELAALQSRPRDGGWPGLTRH